MVVDPSCPTYFCLSCFGWSVCVFVACCIGVVFYASFVCFDWPAATDWSNQLYNNILNNNRYWVNHQNARHLRVWLIICINMSSPIATAVSHSTHWQRQIIAWLKLGCRMLLVRAVGGGWWHWEIVIHNHTMSTTNDVQIVLYMLCVEWISYTMYYSMYILIICKTTISCHKW